MAHIVLIGPGAIGGTVGAAIAGNGRDRLTICARQEFDTLTLTRSTGEQVASHRVSVVTSPEKIDGADWVLLAVKAHQTPDAASWLKVALGPDTRLAVLQNGVEHRDRVAPFVRHGSVVIPVVVQLPAERTAPGKIKTYGGATLTVADDERGRAFAGLFESTLVKVALTDDFMTRQWEKLCLNAASGSLSTITANPDAISTIPGMRDLALRIVEECMAVGRAEGARFANDFARSLVDGFMSRPGNRGNSMYYDRMAGQMLEYDARNSVISRLGRKHGIATPISDTLVPILRALCPVISL
jgi:2-dehydropantoate 2-reductase